MTVPFAVRDTRPLRPYVRAEVLNMMAISPEGRTVAELQTFLITQRPASRDTIARVLSSLVDQGLLAVCNEPAWRRRLRASLLAAALPRKAKGRRVDLRGRQHLLYTQLSNSMWNSCGPAPSPHLRPHSPPHHYQRNPDVRHEIHAV